MSMRMVDELVYTVIFLLLSLCLPSVPASSAKALIPSQCLPVLRLADVKLSRLRRAKPAHYTAGMHPVAR